MMVFALAGDSTMTNDLPIALAFTRFGLKLLATIHWKVKKSKEREQK
jgi:hypothetical protein